MNAFVIGYLMGKSKNNNSQELNESPRSFFKQQNNQQINKLNIDDTKFVGTISTNNMEKKYGSLGDKKQSQEDISGAINKLKNMKG